MTSFSLSFPSPPRPDESLNGLLLRLSGNNFLASPLDLLKAIGIRSKSLYSEKEVAHIAVMLGLDARGLHSAACYGALRSSMAKGAFNRIKHVPVCPQCLVEDPYIRQDWHHQLIRVCVIHRCNLLHVCPDCLAPFDITRPRLEMCRCGSTIDSVTNVAAAEDLFIASLLSRVCKSPGLPGFESLPDDFDQFWLFLANLSLSEPHRKNAAIDFDLAALINGAAFGFASDLPGTFQAFVERAVEAANTQGSASFFGAFGAWYKEMNRNFAGEEYQVIRQIAHKVILEKAKAPINRKMKQISGQMLGLKSCFTSAEAARILRSSPDRIVGLVKAGTLEGKIIQAATIEYCLVDRSVVESHQASASRYISRKELQKLLGTTRRVTDRLIEIGVIQRLADSERPLFAKGEFLIEDTKALMSGLAKRTRNRQCHGSSIGFDEISGKRFPASTANMIYRRIFAGDIAPYEQRPECSGLNAFMFDETDLQTYKQMDVEQHELNITELTRLTGWKHETIKGWIDAGFLIARVDPSRNQVLVSLPNLISFLSTHVVAADAAERMDSKSVWLMRPLMTAGVLAQGTHDTKAGTRRGVLFSTDALINVASKRTPRWSRPSASKQQPRSDLALSAVVDRFCGSRS